MPNGMGGTIDAIVLAGDKKGSRNILGRSKLALEIADKPLLAYVIEALDKVERLRKVVIVGPGALVTGILTECQPGLTHSTRFEVLEQQDTAYQNFWQAFLHTLDQYEPGLEYRDPQILEKGVLVIPADIPLIDVDEIDEFLDAAFKEQMDYGVGMTEERYLERFYPAKGQPGIRMTYLHLASGNLRLNNLHFIRPFKVRNRAYIEKIYEFRYQKEFLNILRVVSDILRTDGFGFRPVYLYAMLQLSVLFNAAGMARSLRFTSRRVTKAYMTRYASIMLQTRVVIIETRGGGCAVDVDSEADYATISLRMAEYSRHSGD